MSDRLAVLLRLETLLDDEATALSAGDLDRMGAIVSERALLLGALEGPSDESLRPIVDRVESARKRNVLLVSGRLAELGQALRHLDRKRTTVTAYAPRGRTAAAPRFYDASA